MLLWAAKRYGDRVSFEEFLPVMRLLLSKHSDKERERGLAGWQWFGLRFDDLSLLPAYYNTCYCLATYEQPLDFVPKQQDVQAFQQYYVRSERKVFASALP